ncbi:hypothetical protein HK100_005272 [Physocladia obscura]|uniref:N-acetyltransferase domain-containing protein n=1 Tax=Physocladia obscura TaxID=109957 RepID=A0AAD5T5W4_9FUNG|nr:hypothetical protein HK100_005272 [Physocladia obscura]
MIIVPATVEHWEVLSALAKQTFDETFGHIYTPSDLETHLNTKYTHDLMVAEIKSEIVYFLCNDDDAAARAPVGFFQLKPNSRNELMAVDEFADPCWELHRFYLTNATQGKGGGSLLMRFALEKLKEVGAKSLWLSVWSENFKAQHFYEKFGIK